MRRPPGSRRTPTRSRSRVHGAAQSTEHALSRAARLPTREDSPLAPAPPPMRRSLEQDGPHAARACQRRPQAVPPRRRAPAPPVRTALAYPASPSRRPRSARAPRATTARRAASAAPTSAAPLRPSNNSTGFKGVKPSRNVDQVLSFEARSSSRDGSPTLHLGTFATAEQAALARARFLGPAGAAEILKQSVGTPEWAAKVAEAHATAAEEGLTLLRADNSTGFLGVKPRPRGQFEAGARRDGNYTYLGRFATAEQAALARARFLGPRVP